MGLSARRSSASATWLAKRRARSDAPYLSRRRGPRLQYAIARLWPAFRNQWELASCLASSQSHDSPITITGEVAGLGAALASEQVSVAPSASA
jgi:hypothetical protein